jgi:hypothetical protein
LTGGFRCDTKDKEYWSANIGLIRKRKKLRLTKEKIPLVDYFISH